MSINKIIDKDKVKASLCEWIKLNMLLLICMLVIRIAFILSIYFRINIDSSHIPNIIYGSLFDLITIFHIVCWGVIPFMILHYFTPRITKGISIGLIFVYSIIALLLTEYFCNTTMPLDQVIFAYSSEEIKGIISASSSINIVPILCFIIPAIIIIGITIMWAKVKINFIFSSICLIVSIICSASLNYSKIITSEKFYNSHTEFCYAINQPSYSIIKIIDFKKHQGKIGNEMSEDIQNAAIKYQNIYQDKEFSDINYPFYHKNNYEDVLGNLISTTKNGEMPNFVFIIIESFGQRLTGVNNSTISFTPFIDSLKDVGLYWNNCLASSDRTFGLLPAIFASAPYGEHGFVQIWEPIPNHNSLLKDMKSNGYEISYYYGGIHEFDRYDIFLKLNNVDYIYKPEISDIDSSKYKTLNDFHRWGIDDEELYRNAMEHKANTPTKSPYIDIYMTLSTHEPFTFDDIDKYKQKVETILSSHKDISSKEKNNIRDNLNIFACYSYADDCIRELMDYYKTLPEYENTIFVITGDHRMGMLPLRVPLFSYNVPLIIYSPLINSPQKMKAVVAHEDITPTINSYLSHNYNYKTSNYCHWLGTSLDTTKAFICNKKMAFMLNNREVVDYLNGNYFISRGKTYKVGEDFDLTIIEDDVLHQKYVDEMNNFNILSQYVVKTNKLKPTENADILYSNTIDFDNNIIDILNEYISESDSNKFVSIYGNVEFAPICPKIRIEKEYKSITNTLEFDVKNIDTAYGLPQLVISMDNYYIATELTSIDEKSLNTGQIEHFKKTISIPAGKESVGKEIKYYLWNKHKANFIYDNINICIEAEK